MTMSMTMVMTMVITMVMTMIVTMMVKTVMTMVMPMVMAILLSLEKWHQNIPLGNLMRLQQMLVFGEIPSNLAKRSTISFFMIKRFFVVFASDKL